MKAEILAVGNEILMGQIANTNAQFLTKELALFGIDVIFHTVVGDDEANLLSAIDNALSRADVLILTGGLGPTFDDITKETLAKYFSMDMVLDEEILANIKSYFDKKGIPMPESNIKQAMMPKGAKTLSNPYGTAPAGIVEENGKIAIFLPGPPYEMKNLFALHLVPYFKAKADKVIHTEYVHIFGESESGATEKIAHLISENPRIAPYVNPGEVMFAITGEGKTEDEAKSIVSNAKEELYNIFGEKIYGEGKDNSLPQAVLALLKEKNLTVSFAESCTGGLLASALCDLSGASDVFSYSAVTYHNEAKKKFLSVNGKTIDTFGVVSKETAMEMADGIRKISGADIGVSTTGYAGPTGGDDENPVGTVYIGIATKDNITYEKIIIPRARNVVRQRATLHAYDLIRRTILAQ